MSEILVMVTCYKNKLIIEGASPDLKHPNWVPAGQGRIGCIVMDTAKHLGVSEEALAWLKKVPRSADDIGDVDWFASGTRHAFGWLGGPLAMVSRDATGSNSYTVPPEGQYIVIPNDVPADAKDIIDEKDGSKPEAKSQEKPAEKSGANSAEPDDVAYSIEGLKITWGRLRDVLTGAFEGGSNYWYLITEFVTPDVGHIPWGSESECFSHIDYPVRKGGAVVVADSTESFTGTMRPVNRETMIEGLKIMISKHFRHFSDVVLEKDDAVTADVFLQCIVFGDVIYG